MTDKIGPLTSSAKKILESAQSQAIQLGIAAIRSENLLLAILADNTSKAVAALKKYINIDELETQVRKSISNKNLTSLTTAAGSSFSSELKVVLEDARREMQNYGVTAITTEHILLGILRSPHCSAGMYLSFYGVNYSTIKNAIDNMSIATSTVASSFTGPAPVATTTTATIPVTKTKSTSKQAKASSPKAPCGDGCSCSDVASISTSTAIPDSVKKGFDSLKDAFTQGLGVVAAASKKASDKNKSRNEWIAILDRAIETSEKTGISVPALFIHESFLNQSTVDKMLAQQLRQEGFADAIEVLLSH